MSTEIILIFAVIGMQMFIEGVDQTVKKFS